MTDSDSTTVDQILERAACAARPMSRAGHEQRADWLEAVASSLEARTEALVAVAGAETHLPEGRLRGELTRTTFQARLFAERLRQGELFPVVVDHANPEWPMGPRPDIRRTWVPIGPVLVFAASNFPFAFSVAGGDTVSALAAGCPVVVKTHPGHPRLSAEVVTTVQQALTQAGAPEGALDAISGLDAGVAAVQDSRVKAAGFTGSVAGGRALFDLASRRADPIPFYGELGSTNPVVVTASAWEGDVEDIVAGFTGSFTLGSGQFCTQPGVVLVPDVAAFASRLDLPSLDPMLSDAIRSGYDAGMARLRGRDGVEVVAQGPGAPDAPAATVLSVSAEAVLASPDIIREEVFGPVSTLVEYQSVDQALEILDLVDGALTCTLHATADDVDAGRLVEAAASIAGRVVWNQWPTGVTVSDAQQHGGPWPATTAPTTTSVGTAAALRFARPVAFQNLPSTHLPPEVRG